MLIHNFKDLPAYISVLFEPFTAIKFTAATQLANKKFMTSARAQVPGFFSSNGTGSNSVFFSPEGRKIRLVLTFEPYKNEIQNTNQYNTIQNIFLLN